MYVITIHGVGVMLCATAALSSWGQWFSPNATGDNHPDAIPSSVGPTENVRLAGEHAGAAFDQFTQAAKGSIEGGAAAAMEKLERVGEGVRENAADILHSSKEKGEHIVGQVKSNLSDLGERVKQTTGETTDYGRGMAKDAAHWTAEHFARLGYDANDLLARMRQRVMGIIRTPPRATSSSGAENGLEGAGHGKLIASGVQVKVLPDYYLIFIDAAGIPITNLHIHCARSQLLVYGSHEECLKPEGTGGVRACIERAIDEVFELPEDADQLAIESWLHLQVLIVKVPRLPLDQERSIKVKQRGSLDKILEKVGLETPVIA